ncbi:MAG: hypothetical protein RLZZ535_1704, partial [Cyanobacteriota bacterium]
MRYFLYNYKYLAINIQHEWNSKAINF